jgi:hypothetical protein
VNFSRELTDKSPPSLSERRKQVAHKTFDKKKLLACRLKTDIRKSEGKILKMLSKLKVKKRV